VLKTAVCSLTAAWLVVGAATQTPDAMTLTFDQDKVGAPPPGFAFAAMRQPGPGSWLVERPGSNGHLVHVADRLAQGYALAVYDGPSWRDVNLSVRLRLAGGRRAGGLVWHYVDNQNYYATVLDVTRGELAMYRVAGGNRIRMEFEDDLELDAEAWHTMKIAHTGKSTRVSLGGIRVFEDDHRGQDRPATGRVGLIAAGDADVWFDDIRIDPPAR
jgi:hypothetical protein